MNLKKIVITMKNLRKTAYHHYGKRPSSLLKFVYYSALRINTFIFFEKDLNQELPPHNLDPEFRVVKPTLDELAIMRKGLDLPREFYYDEIANAKTCYVVLKDDEIAKIYWVFFKGDHNRFLILGDGVAELNYNTTLEKFRGRHLMAKMISYISLDLQKAGYKKIAAVIHESNPPAIRAIESAGFMRAGKIKTLGPFNRRVKIS